MRTGILLSYSGGFRETVQRVVELEKPPPSNYRPT
jgi:hypothetical protein